MYPPIKLLSSLFLSACLITLLFAPVNPVTAAEEEPTLAFSTYLGGNGNERGQSITLDSAGNIYVVGATGSDNFPATDPYNVSTPNVYGIIYVTKFDPTGLTQIYSILLGEGDALDIAVDQFGAAYVVGRAINIPTVNAIQTTKGSNQDAFIAKVNPAGTALVYSTYLGGNGEDLALGVALDANRNAYVVGATGSTNFPTHNPFQASYGGGQWDVFLARLNATGTALVYSTYYGGSIWDISMDIAVDSTGNAYITGDTGSNDFPVVNAYQPEHANWCQPAPTGGSLCTDIYVAKFSPSGTPLYSTYLGGDGNYERGNAIAINSLGSAYITGVTSSSNFPTTPNAYQPTPPNGGPAFISTLSPDGSELLYSTYLGGTTDGSNALSIALDVQGSIYVAGATWASDFPTVSPIQAEKAGPNPNPSGSISDAFVTKFSADGQSILFSTYFGGSEDEYIEFSPRLAVDKAGSIYLTGTTTSDDFPILNAYQSEPGGAPSSPYITYPNHDSFLVKITLATISSPDEAAERNYFTTHTPTLTWKPVTWALGYRVQVNKSEAFDLPNDFEGDALASADSITTDELDNGFYYWRILAQKPDGTWGNVSPIDSFTIDAD